MKPVTESKFVLALCLLVLAVMFFGAVDVFAAAESGRWWERLTPEGKLVIMAFAVAGIAVLIVIISVLKPKMPVQGAASFTLEKYEEILRDKVAGLKVDLQFIREVDSPEYRKISAALKEAEQRLLFVESGYKNAMTDITGLAGQLEILRGWVSETEIESAESMLASGSTGQAREIWAKIATESGIKKEAYARREADAYYHIGLLAKSELNYPAAMEALLKGIKTGKAGIAHMYEAGNLALVTGDYRQAEELFKASLGLACETDECSRNIIGKCQRGLGDVYMHFGKHTEARPLYQAALSSALAIYGEESVPVADGYARVAQCREKLGQSEEAVQLCRKALDIYSELLPDEHPKVQDVRERCRIVLED